MKEKLSEQELKALVDDEIANAMGEFGTGSELVKDRTKSMDYYLGEPMGNEVEGRSQVIARDVFSTVEWILPSLVRMFMDRNAVEIAPKGPEDEQAARQETDYLHHLFWQKNEGFLVLYSWFKDALLQKNGILKHWVDATPKETRETYTDLIDEEMVILASDPELEIIEHEEKLATMDTGQTIRVHDATFIRREDDPQVVLEVVPPEEFLISRDARSPNPKKARFVGQYTFPTVSDLREMGYSETQIDQMENAPNRQATSEESISRRNLDDEDVSGLNITNKAMVQKEMVEGYLRADVNGDGIAELLKVMRSGDFLDYEEVDSVPFNSVTPFILTHKFYGLSVADLLDDIQDIRTSLMRGYLDNIHQSINGTTYFNSRVNLEDMLVSTPYGIRYVEDDGPVQDAVMHIPGTGLPAQAYQLLDVVDRMRTDRLGDFQLQLDPQVLKDANTGVVTEMLNEARAKVEMIARIFAETGVKQLFRDLHELARKHSNKDDVIQLNGNWVPVDPRQWRERTDFEVRVGIGTRNRLEERGFLREALDIQQILVQGGGNNVLVDPQRIYNALYAYAETFGEVNPDKYFMNPQTAPPPQPEPPETAILIAQIGAQIEMAKMQVQQQRNEMENSLKTAQLQLDAQNNAARQQVDALKAEIANVRTQSQNMTDQAKVQLEAKAQNLEADLEAAKLMVEQTEAMRDQHIDVYREQLRAATDMALSDNKQVYTEANANAQKTLQDQAKMLQALTNVMERLDTLQTEQSTPKEIERDENGLIIRIGNKRIKRDEDGNALGIE